MLSSRERSVQFLIGFGKVLQYQHITKFEHPLVSYKISIQYVGCIDAELCVSRQNAKKIKIDACISWCILMSLSYFVIFFFAYILRSCAIIRSQLQKKRARGTRYGKTQATHRSSLGLLRAARLASLPHLVTTCQSLRRDVNPGGGILHSATIIFDSSLILTDWGRWKAK